VTEWVGGAGTGGRNVGLVWRFGLAAAGGARSLCGRQAPPSVLQLSATPPPHHYDCKDNYIHDFGYDCAHHHEQTSHLSPEYTNQQSNSMRR
jgi:hypothetical protein